MKVIFDPETDTLNIILRDEKVSESDEVRDVLRKETEKRGIDSFDVFIDGQEIEDSDDLPATFEGLAIVEVRRSVKAGN